MTSVTSQPRANQPPLILGSVDEYLGPAATRFFGHGFRRVRYSLSEPAMKNLPSGRGVVATARVDYPLDWSTKADDNQRPHLSSIDALTLGQWACQAAADALAKLDDDQVTFAVITKVHLRAAGRPDEDLSAIPVSAVPREVTPASSTYDVRVGSMRLSLVLSHDGRLGVGHDFRSYRQPHKTRPSAASGRRHCRSQRLSLHSSAHQRRRCRPSPANTDRAGE